MMSSASLLSTPSASAKTFEVGIHNFRPNLVVTGCDRPHIEDSWASIHVHSPSTSTASSPRFSELPLVPVPSRKSSFYDCQEVDDDDDAEDVTVCEHSIHNEQNTTTPNEQQQQQHPPPRTNTDDVSHSTSHDGIHFDISGPCSRCAMINVNGETGIVDGRALQTLSGYRRGQGYRQQQQQQQHQHHELAGDNGTTQPATAMNEDSQHTRNDRSINFGQFLCYGPRSTLKLRSSVPVYIETGATITPEMCTQHGMGMSMHESEYHEYAATEDTQYH